MSEATYIDIPESSKADLPANGKSRIIRVGGTLQRLEFDGTGGALGGATGSGAPITLGAPAATWDVVTGADLNGDGGWEFAGYLASDTNGVTISVRLNADASNHLAGLVGGAASTSFDLHSITSVDIGLWVWFRIEGKTGQPKRLTAWCARNTDNTAPNFQVRSLIGTYTQTANITSVRLVVSAGNLTTACSLVQTKLGRQL